MLNTQLSRRQKKTGWRDDELQTLFKLAKANATLEETKRALPSRTEQAILDKLVRMGFGCSNGIIGKPRARV